MADEPDNIVLVYLRRIDEKVDRLIDDVRDLKVRVTGLEENVVGIHRRMDRFEARLDRIERRLDLVDTHS
jgi:predicted  nucleic acid-binding Zn-ribbon protein